MRYTDYVNSGKLQTDICLDELLKLFMNHKSTKLEDITELKKVFKVVGKTGEDPSSIPNIDQENFINFLKLRGEAFKDKDFNKDYAKKDVISKDISTKISRETNISTNTNIFTSRNLMRKST